MSRAQLVIVVAGDMPGQDPTQDDLLANLRVSSTGDIYVDADTPTPADQPITPTSAPLYFEDEQTVTLTTSAGSTVSTTHLGAPSGSNPSPRVIEVSPDDLSLATSSASGSGTSLPVLDAFAFDTAGIETELGAAIGTIPAGALLWAALLSLPTPWSGGTATNIELGEDHAGVFVALSSLDLGGVNPNGSMNGASNAVQPGGGAFFCGNDGGGTYGFYTEATDLRIRVYDFNLGPGDPTGSSAGAGQVLLLGTPQVV